jgi:hypothetical protein
MSNVGTGTTPTAQTSARKSSRGLHYRHQKPQMPQPSIDGTKLAHFRRSLGRTDWRSVAGMTAFIAVLHVLGFGILFGLVAPRPPFQ